MFQEVLNINCNFTRMLSSYITDIQFSRLVFLFKTPDFTATTSYKISLFFGRIGSLKSLPSDDVGHKL